jgi:hypothetical protein
MAVAAEGLGAGKISDRKFSTPLVILLTVFACVGKGEL